MTMASIITITRPAAALALAAAASLLLGCPYPDVPDCWDEDGDGYGDAANYYEGCAHPELPDCDDSNPDVHPGAAPTCDGVEDNDCDGIADDNEVDDDGDGFSECGDGSASGDCDDSDDTVAPGAPEYCDGVDNDCDGQADEAEDIEYLDYWPDADGDSFGDAEAAAVNDCAPVADHVTDDTDCDDTDDATYPGAGELCDGIDNDCDETVPADEDDADGDGYRVCDDDCDDTDDTRHPGATELCDGHDNDCDGSVPADEVDADSDTYRVCDGDCDDSVGTVYPGAIELCDEIDNDCDGSAGADEVDGDGDGQMVCAHDCDDADATVYTGADELCDGLDNDCDTVLPADEVDNDGDARVECLWDAGGWDGDAAVTGDQDCDDADADNYPGNTEDCDGADNDCDGYAGIGEVDGDGDGFMLCEDDCDDGDPLTYDGAIEQCDGIDNDCDGVVPADETDDDGDGRDECGDLDCDDGDGTVYPGASELCDGQDNDCDGSLGPAEIDDDADSYTECDGDCDDADGSAYPGAAEICGDGIDQDCDGLDEVCSDCDIEVPGDHSFIQDAIGAAADGDMICVAPGTYNEAIDFVGKGVHLLGVEGPELTVIDPLGAGSVVSFVSGEGADSILEGFTLTGGNASNGGGIRIEGASPFLTRLAITANTVSTSGRGAGIHIDDGGPQLSRIRVTDNGSATTFGGGISVGGTSIVDFQSVTIADNEGGRCGGLYATDDAAVFLRNVWISGNTAVEAGGGAFLTGYSHAELTNVVFAGNDAGNESGGVYWDNATGFIRNSAFVDNTAVNGGGGASIYYQDIEITNLTVTGNSAGGAGGGLRIDSANPTITNVNAWNNSPDDYDGISDPTGILGNIAEDPLFMDTAAADPLDWDLHLAGTSPLIDAGNNAIQDPDGGPSDIGAYGGPGAGDWDLDGDGFSAWWQPGAYDPQAYPALDLDCDDGDGSVLPVDCTCDLADVDGDGYSECDGDCDDGDPRTHPGALEACDGADNDCDGVVPQDEFTDGDGDGVVACADCDDANAGWTEEGCVTSMAAARIIGLEPGDYVGISFAAIDDSDGDGYDELLVGANNAGDYDQGVAYLFDQPLTGLLSPDDATASFIGEDPGDGAGASVAAAGDVNNDGTTDFLIAAKDHEEPGYNGYGAVYVIHGPPTGHVSLGTADGRLIGRISSARLGESVASAGDVDGDGNDDIVIGAHHTPQYGNGSDVGAAYVIRGPILGDVLLTNAAGADDLGPDDAVFWGSDFEDRAGAVVAGALDFNGDGLDDVIIGAEDDNLGGNDAGAVYVVYGPTAGEHLLHDVPGAGLGVSFWGESANDHACARVASAGDVNGDNYDDLIVGAHQRNGNDGAAYLVLGSATPTSHSLAAADVRLYGDNGVGEWLGIAVSGAGDIDGDQNDDLMLGAYHLNDYAGAVYFVTWADIQALGTYTASVAASHTLVGDTDANPGTGLGQYLAALGDVDGDTLVDFAMSGYQENLDAGAVYQISGVDLP